MIFRSVKMKAIQRQIMMIASWITGGQNSDTVVYFEGETGTGKTTIAGELARSAARWPFVVINGAAVNPDLAMSEIFGHVRGSFSGAVKDRAGAIAEAKGGILFIDEVTSLRKDVQGALLRVVRERKYRRVGESGEERDVECVLLFASCHDLDALVAAGEFRRDLKARITMVRIHVPPLRERIKDVKALALLFAEEKGIIIEPGALSVIQTYEYPENVGDLRNLISACAIMGAGTISEPIAREWVATQRGRRAEVVRMTPKRQRREEVRRLLATGSYSAAELAEVFDVHPDTIWRDVKAINARQVGGGRSARYTLLNSVNSVISEFGDYGVCRECGAENSDDQAGDPTLTTDPSNTDRDGRKEDDDAA